MVLAPGCYDALGARLVEEAGFSAAYMTGFGSAASRLGRPDVGLMTLPEMVDNARRIAQAVDIPVIADADTGYGNPINVIRTVREYEAAACRRSTSRTRSCPRSAATWRASRSCPAEEMAAKIAAAVAARRSPEFLIIARTDARAVEGLDARARRGRRATARRAPTSCSWRRRSRVDEIEPVGRALPGRAAAVQLRRGRQDAAARRMHACASSGSRWSSSRCRRSCRRRRRCARRWPG